MDAETLLNDLNLAQKQAVSARAENQLVLAGAGSGKTRVLVHRIAWLIRVENLSPHQILAVTFTNKAAREMRERLDGLLGDSFGYQAMRAMWVGTFHGIAHRLLKAHWQEAGLPQNFQILDSDDQLRVVKRVYAELNMDEGRWPYRQAQWFINGQKDEGLRAKYVPDSRDPFMQTMKLIYSAYEEACERGGLVDFAELLLRSHELWLKKPDLLAHYQQRFKFILVDEFQDTNAVQYAWLRVLAGSTAKVTAVGDDDQSIYGWRGARIENIQQFEDEFSDVQITRLEQNYRSTGNILKAANSVIANNHSRLGKNLWTSGLEGEAIDLYSAFNEQDEARYIVERIKSWQEKGGNYVDVAILYRSNAQSRVLEEAFIREGMPYRIYGGQRFYERLEIKNALAYLRLILNRNDDAAFERIINTPTRGIGSKTVDTIRVLAREQRLSLWEALQGAIKNTVFSARANNALLSFVSLIASLEEAIKNLNLDEQVDHVIKQSGLLEYHKNEKGERGQARVENLEELVNACQVFEVENEALSPLQEFLDSAALDAGERQADEYEDAVQMMTLHSAKGLEFPLVFLSGLEEGLFPHRMSLDEASGIEEERRLCYVGITRAMEKLIISHAECRRMHGTENFNALSRFIREIPPECIQEVRIKSTISRPISLGGRNTFKQDEDEYSGFRLGNRVLHHKFGEGIILEFEGQGPKAFVTVNFDNEGLKKLAMQYAKLERLA